MSCSRLGALNCIVANLWALWRLAARHGSGISLAVPATAFKSSFQSQRQMYNPFICGPIRTFKLHGVGGVRVSVARFAHDTEMSGGKVLIDSDGLVSEV